MIKKLYNKYIDVLDRILNLGIESMNIYLKIFIHKVKKLLVLMIAAQLLCWNSIDLVWAAEYASLIEARQATTTPRTYTLEANEISPTVLGTLGDEIPSLP